MSPETIFLLLVAAAFLAGFVDAIAGGGGMITVPALLIGGFDPLTALGTNKLQSLFGSGSATISYARNGHVDLASLLPAAALAFAGAAAGALLAANLPLDLLRTLLPFLLIAIAVYFAVKPGLSDIDRERRISPRSFALFVVPLVGAYDGLFGPGTGSFFMLAFVGLAGYGVLKATAHTKLLNFASNVGGFAVFAAVGSIHWKLGLAMGVAQFLGARLGAASAMRFGARLIRPLLVTVCIALAVKLLWS
ncbi:TSUP family transporter [Aureimonas sp. AU12]|uniref:TSUP family transporter n=1 Tax=Aureimonas sp. AU12 TaxID=1638161 RepID=UPI000784E68F|nr:TSUP family transporter [Aureimonas sp. AU12]